MYLRKYKISEAAFLENISQQPSLYIIWFRVSPKRKCYFMSETHLKPSQTSKIKLLEKVVNVLRDVFKTVFSIQNILKTSEMALFTKIMNGWKQFISCYSCSSFFKSKSFKKVGSPWQLKWEWMFMKRLEEKATVS